MSYNGSYSKDGGGGSFSPSDIIDPSLVDGQLVTFDVATQKLIPAVIGATLSDSVAITQTQPITTMNVSGSNQTLIVPNDCTTIAANVDGVDLTLDFGEPTTLPSGSISSCFVYVNLSNGGTVKFKLTSPYVWFNDNTEEFIVDEISTVNVRLFNNAASGGILQILPLNTNVYTDAEKAKLGGIEPLAEVNHTDAEIKIQYEANSDTNAFTDTEKTKLGSLTGGRYLGVFADLAALQLAHPTGLDGDNATVTSPNANLFYWGGATWLDSGTGYIGDMLKVTYDPTNVAADAFGMVNMVESATEKVLTNLERDIIATVPNLTTTDIINASGWTGLDTSSALDNIALEFTNLRTSIGNTSGYEVSSDNSTETVGFLSAVNATQLQITNNGLGSNFSNLPDGVTEFITQPDGNVMLDQLDGIYSITLQFNILPTTRDKTYLVEFIINAATTPTLLLARQLRLAKRIITESTSISFTLPSVIGLVGVPISIFITLEDTDAKIWGQGISVTKNNAPLLP